MVLRGSNINNTDKIYSDYNKLIELNNKILQINEEINKLDNKSDNLKNIDKDLDKILFNLQNNKYILENNKNNIIYNLNNSLYLFGIGSISGAISRTIVAPIDRVKILMQTGNLIGIKNDNMTHIIKYIKKDGITKFWKGNMINCMRIMPHTGIQFSSYNLYKKILNIENNQITFYQRLLLGSLAGMSAALVTHPIDIIRIRIQTQKNVNNINSAIKNIYYENGIKNFYKGFKPAILSITPFIGLNFAIYDSLKYYHSYNPILKDPYISLCIGGISGLIAQTICYPLDTIRRRMEVYGKNYTSISNAYYTILNKEGIKGLYKGMIPNMIKIIPNNALRFGIFSCVCQYYNINKI